MTGQQFFPGWAKGDNNAKYSYLENDPSLLSSMQATLSGIWNRTLKLYFDNTVQLRISSPINFYDFCKFPKVKICPGQLCRTSRGMSSLPLLASYSVTWYRLAFPRLCQLLHVWKFSTKITPMQNMFVVWYNNQFSPRLDVFKSYLKTVRATLGHWVFVHFKLMRKI